MGSINVCTEYNTKCNSDQISTCASYRYVDDMEKCESDHYICDTQVIEDSNCQSECTRREESFEYY